MAVIGSSPPVGRPAARPIGQHGIRAILPAGWDGAIYRRAPSEGEQTHAVLHAASFPLPPTRGDYGSEVVELMGATDVLVALLEFGPASATTPLFTGHPRPSALAARDFSPNSLQRPLPNQAGVQRFFVEQGRSFCLYVVLGSFFQAPFVLPSVNQLLGALEISTAP